VTTVIPHITEDELRLRLSGGLHRPGEPGYEDACVLFNSMPEHRPRLVARCAAPDDIVAALAYARGEGLPIAVRAGGHSVTGLSLADDGLVLDVRGMDQVEVDPVGRIARVGGGANWSQVDRATQPYGLAAVGGRVSSTGVAGLTLGGGSGWLERAHGLACDNLISAQLVTADGRFVTASETENPELLWALRGGGGNFGVVTEFVFRLHEVGDEVLGGIAFYPASRGREVMTLWRDVMEDAPPLLSLACMYMYVPDDEQFPEPVRDELCVLLVGMYAGPVAEGEQALRAIRDSQPKVDLIGPMAYADVQCALDDPPGYRNYWTAENLTELPDEAIEAIAARSEVGAPGSQVFMVAWGGAIDRTGSDRSPLAGRDTRWIIHPLIMWEDPAEDAERLAYGRSFHDLLAPWSTGDAYLNFVSDGADRIQSAFGAENHAKLARIKAAWDPDDVFRAHGHVAPAA
jgi:FAD/FMN-containing dehydrogenase